MDNSKRTLKEFLRSIKPLNDEELDKIVSGFEPKKFSKGEYLLKTTKVSNDYLYLESGLMRTFLFDIEGNEITTDFHTSDNVVFEVSSFFKRTPSEVNIEALTECKAYRISFNDLNTLFHERMAFRDIGRSILVREFSSSQQRNYNLINQSAEQRYHNLMKSRPEIFIHSPLKYIASYLGVTDSTLSRIRKKSTPS